MGHSHHTGAAAEHHGPVLQLQFPGLRHGVGVGGWPPAQMGLWHQLAEDLGSVPCTGCLMMPVQDMPTWGDQNQAAAGQAWRDGDPSHLQGKAPGLFDTGGPKLVMESVGC